MFQLFHTGSWNAHLRSAARLTREVLKMRLRSRPSTLVRNGSECNALEFVRVWGPIAGADDSLPMSVLYLCVYADERYFLVPVGTCMWLDDDVIQQLPCYPSADHLVKIR